MYLIIYQKSNGQLLERIRNTLPHYSVGEETSMGWLILDIKYRFDDSYYSFRDYKILIRQ